MLDKDAAIPIQRAVEAAKAGEQPLKAHGGTGANQHTVEEESRGDDVTSANEAASRGNNNSSLLRRLARDAPDILDAYERGEYPSVRQAEIAVASGR